MVEIVERGAGPLQCFIRNLVPEQARLESSVINILAVARRKRRRPSLNEPLKRIANELIILDGTRANIAEAFTVGLESDLHRRGVILETGGSKFCRND